MLEAIASRRREIAPASEGEAPKLYSAYGLVVDPHAKLDFTTHGRGKCYNLGVKLRAIRLAIAEGHIMPPNDEKYPETFRVYHTGSRLSVCLLRDPPTPGENVVDEVFFDREFYGDRTVPTRPDKGGDLEEYLFWSGGQICHEMEKEFDEEKKAWNKEKEDLEATIAELQGQLDNNDFGGCDCNNCWYGGNSDNDYCRDDYCCGNGERHRDRLRDAADANMHEQRMAEEETRREKEKATAAQAKANEAQAKVDEALYAAFRAGFESQSALSAANIAGMKSLRETAKAYFETCGRPKEVPKTDSVEDNNQHDDGGERDRKRQRR
ncbi:MAG: hypothetical protein SGARI_006883 [Bacillariaceae sp.]